MLIFSYLFLLLMETAEVKDFNITGCLHKHTDVRYRAVSDQKFVVSCDLPPEDPDSIFNSSHLYESQLQWFWQSSDGGVTMRLKSKTINPTLQGNALWFNPITVEHSGTYICINREKTLMCANIFIDVQTKKMANCSDSSTNDNYLFVLRGANISCPGKDCYSNFQRSPVKWYKNGRKLRLRKDERPTLQFQHDKILFRYVYEIDNGTYICDYMLIDNSTQWTVRTIVNVNIISKDTINPPKILDPSGLRTLEVELGQPLELKCKAQFGFELNASSSMQWYRENGESKKLLQQIWVHPKGLEGECFVHIFNLMNVTEEDLSSQFICHAQNSIGNSIGVFKLKKRTERAVYLLLILCCAVITIFIIFSGSMMAYRHRIEIVLLYQNYVAKDETVGDGKEFDAFVSYAKPDSPEADQALLVEEKFALDILPQVLEKKYGYKLCLTERDILPGGAYTDDIVNAVKKSRRAIMVLSPNYVNGPALFELEAAVNTALEDRTIKLILIQFESFHEPESLPHNVKAALRVLPRITWKTSPSPTANKQFWRKLQYRMPVKHTNGSEGQQPSFSSLQQLGMNNRKDAAGRRSWTKKWRKIWERTSLN